MATLKIFIMISIHTLIVIFASLSFMGYIAVLQKANEDNGIGRTLFSENSIVKIIFCALGLVPLYFIYQHNSLIITILKFIGINIANMILLAVFLRNKSIGTISLISISLGVISGILLLINLFL